MATKRLADAGIGTASLDARILILAAGGIDHAGLIARGEEVMPEGVAQRFLGLVDLRGDGRPIAQIVGEKEFYGRTFAVDEHALIPRPESEHLIEAALPFLPEGGRVLDLGTGSGCLLLTLLAEIPGVTGIGVDISEGALALATRNAALLGVASRSSFSLGDFATAPMGPFDVIVSNPPYIGTSETLGPGVREYEPGTALFAGEDGLDQIRRLGPIIGARLGPQGAAFVEIGAGQGKAARALLAAGTGRRHCETGCDLAGLDRYVAITPPLR